MENAHPYTISVTADCHFLLNYGHVSPPCTVHQYLMTFFVEDGISEVYLLVTNEPYGGIHINKNILHTNYLECVNSGYEMIRASRGILKPYIIRCDLRKVGIIYNNI
jgi:hypothetical protein